MPDKTIRIAVVTDDGQTISRHFGRAKFYAIYTAVNGEIVGQEQVVREVRHNHHHHQQHHQHEVHLHEHGADDHDHEHDHDHGHDHDHAAMFEPLAGCAALLSRGMGRGAYVGLQGVGVQPVVTDIAHINEAVAAYLDGTIVDHPEKLH